MVCTSGLLKLYMELGSYFVSVRTNEDIIIPAQSPTSFAIARCCVWYSMAWEKCESYALPRFPTPCPPPLGRQPPLQSPGAACGILDGLLKVPQRIIRNPEDAIYPRSTARHRRPHGGCHRSVRALLRGPAPPVGSIGKLI
jgi:hypothetical protein